MFFYVLIVVRPTDATYINISVASTLQGLTDFGCRKFSSGAARFISLFRLDFLWTGIYTSEPLEELSDSEDSESETTVTQPRNDGLLHPCVLALLWEIFVSDLSPRHQEQPDCLLWQQWSATSSAIVDVAAASLAQYERLGRIFPQASYGSPHYHFGGLWLRFPMFYLVSYI